MVITDLLVKNRQEFISLCKKHKVSKLYAFGSVLRDDFNPNLSDIDLQVEISEDDPLEKGDLLLAFLMASEAFFNRKVDLLTDQRIENPYLRSAIESTKKLIYNGESQQILV